MKWQIHRLNVPAEATGQRLDQFLATACPDLSRTRAKKVIDLGGVHVDGRRVRNCSQSVREGGRIEVYLDQLPLEPFRLTPEQILFRDPYLLVLNKPAGIDTQPTHARYKGTLYEALQQLLHDPFRPKLRPELGMVQRLDRGTSGVMVFSIHPRAHKGLTELFVEHRVEKRYLALVGGCPDPAAGELRSLLARSRRENRVMPVARGGKEAITRYRTLECYPQAALVELELLTGRSHQIRAHMTELDCPLLGDARYGGSCRVREITLERPMLHAAKLAFEHPVTGQALSFELELPADMQALLQRLKGSELS